MIQALLFMAIVIASAGEIILSAVNRQYQSMGAALDAFYSRAPEILLSGPAGTGKAQPLNVDVWTPEGRRSMGDLTIGSRVLTPDGGVATITAIPFRGWAPVWRVTFSDGSVTECTDGHLWEVSWRDSSEREHRATLPFVELLRLGLQKRRGTRPKFEVPITAPVYFDSQPLPIPPYTLGVLLGDGYLRPGEVSFTTADAEIAERVAAEMAPLYRLTIGAKTDNAALQYRIVADGWRPRRPSRAKAGYVSRTSSGKWMARVRLPDQPCGARYIGNFDTPQAAQAAIDAQAHSAFSLAERTGDGIHAEIDRLGLRNTRSATKFIPDIYKYNSVAARWELLRGLMDTDGYADVLGVTVSYTSVGHRLAKDVQWLVQSLGGVARITDKQPPNGSLAYTVWIRLPNPADAFYLSRKRERVRSRTARPRRWIVDVDPAGQKEAQCVTIDDPRGLYLADGFIVTHNSRALLELMHLRASKYPGSRHLITRKTRASLSESGLVTFEEKVLPPTSRIKGNSKRRYRQVYEYPNGSEISFPRRLRDT